MLLPTLVASLLNFPLELAQVERRYTRSRFCEREVRGPDQTRAFARLEVDRRHRPLQRTLFLSGREWVATWEFSERFDLAQPLAELRPPVRPLPSDTQFPVTATVRFDGTAVWRLEFDRPNTTVIVPADPKAGTPGSLHPGVDLSASTRGLPSLFRVRTVEIVLQSAQGFEIDSQQVKMPEWTPLESQLSEAFAFVEDEWRRRRCRPHVIVSAS
jgi:hypothetical protein